MEERLQKILAQAGFGSRRSCEELITAHRVRVNGKIAELGSRADAAKDSISVDGQGIPKIAAHMYIALNKPRDVLSDIDPEDPRKTVNDLIQVPGHLFAVGRLDYESEGLILMTNDGELANRLTHPRYGHEKEYHVLVGNRPDDEQLAAWRRGIVLADGYRTRPAEVFIDSLAGKGAWLRVVLREGRKRQIREVGARIGLPVMRILRVRIGTLLLGDLKVGEWRHLTADEVRRLSATVEKPVRNLTPRSTFTQPRSSERRPARGGGEDSRSEQRPPRREAGEGRSERNNAPARRTSGERSEWKPAPRSHEGEEQGEWRPAGHPKSSEDRPARKPASWPRAGAAGNDRDFPRRSNDAAPDRDHKPRTWQNRGGAAVRPDSAAPDADRKPRTWQPRGGDPSRGPESSAPDAARKPRTWQPRGGDPSRGSESSAPDADRKPRTWQKPGGSSADHRSGGRPSGQHNRPGASSGGRSGARTKGPRNPRS